MNEQMTEQMSELMMLAELKGASKEDYLKETDAMRALEALGIGICIKDATGRVHVQNETCRKYCGVHNGDICKRGCREYNPEFAKPGERAVHTKALVRRLIGDSYFDIIYLSRPDCFVTILHPSNGKYREQLRAIEEIKLTAREHEIAKLMLQGFSNRDLCGKLAISHATLKTHINRITKKSAERPSSFHDFLELRRK